MNDYIIDTHIHLNDDRYKDDLDDVIKRSKDSGVKRVILIGCDPEGIDRALDIQKKDQDNFIYLAFGIHPVDAKVFKDEHLDMIREIVKENNKVVAIGEIGLDYYHHPEEAKLQKEVFKKQIDLAKELELPIIIHSREAVQDCYKILEEEEYFNGVIHAFSEDYKSAKSFLEKGMYVGIGGPVTFKNGKPQQDVVENIDIEKLLIETDGPYLAPSPFRGKRNESSYLKYVVEKISEIRNLSKDEIIKQTTKNAKCLFRGLDV